MRGFSYTTSVARALNLEVEAERTCMAVEGSAEDRVQRAWCIRFVKG